MNAHMQTDTWIYSTLMVLTLPGFASMVSNVFLMFIDQSVFEIIMALESRTVSGLGRLFMPRR